MIRPVTPDAIEPYKRDATRAGLTFGARTNLYGAYAGDLLVGFCGVVWYRDHAKLKDAYVLPQYRRQGVYRAMFEARLEQARRRRCAFVVATCTGVSLPLWLAQRASVIRRFQRYTMVRLVL